MKPNEPSPQGGFSLIELFIVLVLLSIITTFALLAFGSAKVDLNRQAVVREFKIYLERARFDSVKRRAEDPNRAAVTLNSATSFTVRLDYNDDGTLQAGETRTVDFSQRSNTQILVTDTLNYPVTISFDRRGHVTTIDGSDNEINPIFTICTNCEEASPDNSVISLSTTGTVSISSDQPDPSALPTPVVTNVNVTPNCYIYVPGANANANVRCPLQ
jgi:prepilin-type N-terminal cleavage/methylation domain-containing protein